jgi:hypothetical protein
MGSLPRQFKSSAIMDLFARIANPELFGLGRQIIWQAGVVTKCKQVA